MRIELTTAFLDRARKSWLGGANVFAGELEDAMNEFCLALLQEHERAERLAAENAELRADVIELRKDLHSAIHFPEAHDE